MGPVKALILAAGEGQRLRPLTLDRPKPMLSVGDRPLLEQIVLLLKRYGITEIAINLHYKPEAIVDYFGQGERLGVRIHYSFEEQLLGSAGAARRLKEYLRDGPFLVFYGDLYTDLNVSELISVHQQSNALLTMALYKVDNPTSCGIVELDAQGRVTRFVEKPAPDQVFSRTANAGVFVVAPRVLNLIPPDIPIDFGRDVFPEMLESELPIRGYQIRDLLIDIGTFENYERAQRIAVERSQMQRICVSSK